MTISQRIIAMGQEQVDALPIEKLIQISNTLALHTRKPHRYTNDRDRATMSVHATNDTLTAQAMIAKAIERKDA